MFRRYLVIGGTGQVGFTLCKELVKRNIPELILHGFNADDVKENQKKLHHYIRQVNSKTRLLYCYGNILLPRQYKKYSLAQFLAHGKVINYINKATKESKEAKTGLGYFISKFNPDIVVNCVNIATDIAYNVVAKSSDRAASNNQPLPSGFHILNQHVIDLYQVLIGRKIKYIQVSTTGFGGMGFNMLWTHGEGNHQRVSENLLFKASVAGALNQLLWNLSHTKGFDISVVVPAALIGWEKAGVYNLQKNNQSIYTEKISAPISIDAVTRYLSRSKKKTTLINDFIVQTGENGTFGLDEFIAISDKNQMRIITKEEVVRTILNVIQGSKGNNILYALDKASLFGSAASREARKKFLYHEVPHIYKGYTSIAWGNLGPYTTKLAHELSLIVHALGGLPPLLILSKREIAKSIDSYLLRAKKHTESILAIGLPIVLSSRRIFFPIKLSYPSVKVKNLSKNQILEWMNEGWVDVRLERVQFWKEIFSNLSKKEFLGLTKLPPHLLVGQCLASALTLIENN